MSLTKKRLFASWVLLAVFVPMCILSSIHVHEDVISSETVCAECVAHHCHGHIAQTDASVDACLLCQFLSMSFVVAAIAVAAISFNVSRPRYALLSSSVYDACRGFIVTRGPPAV